MVDFAEALSGTLNTPNIGQEAFDQRVDTRSTFGLSAPVYLRDYIYRQITIGPNGSAANDLTGYLQDVMSEVSARGGGDIGLTPEHFEIKSVSLQTGVNLVGSLWPDRGDTFGTVVAQSADSGVEHFITRASPSIRNFGFSGITFVGDKANNPNTNWMYLTNSDTPITTETSPAIFCEQIVVRDWGGAGIKTYASTSDFNVRNIFMRDVLFRRNGTYGMEFEKLTDSYFQRVITAGNGLGALRALDMGSVYLDQVKGYYNGVNAALTSASFYFFGLSSSRINIQAQEEYNRGIFMRQAIDTSGLMIVDGNGYPRNTPAIGVQGRYWQNCDFDIVAASLHAGDGFLQQQALLLASATDQPFAGTTVRVKASGQVINAPTTTVETGGSFAGFDLTYNGERSQYGLNGDRVATKVNTATEGGEIAEFDLYSAISSLGGGFRLFRNTVSTAPIGSRPKLVISKGDGTSSNSHFLEAGGNVKIGDQFSWNTGHLEAGPYHIWQNGGILMIKLGAPTSATDGTVIGTQT